MAAQAICKIDGCCNPMRARGWCNRHWLCWDRNGDPLVTRRPGNGRARRYLTDVVLPYRGDTCLIWPFGRNAKGYAIIGAGEASRLVSRLVCTDAHGPPPGPDHEAAHSCGRGHIGCVAGVHLYWATKAENEADKAEHGTLPRGERCGTSKLNEADVREIRHLRGAMSQGEIAELFSVTRTNVSAIHTGRSWAWLK